jgi:hypothetical protein
MLGTFDTVAKGEVLGIKQHNCSSEEGGGCTVCKHPGIRLDGKTCYPYEPIPSPNKTQEEVIKEFTQDKRSKSTYIKFLSPLINIQGFDIFRDNGNIWL